MKSSTDPRAIIRRPILSEKGTRMRMSENVYLFVVDRNANKLQIAAAVEEIFKVKVKGVRTINQHGKPRRTRLVTGHRSDWKKAVVTLEKDQTIDVFDQV
ncbi:MAG: 50S ribosomal protein L23 [Candidatus Eisenbacteria bacterium]|uniref:Large ribosomal subunit protein uL23 n=1 Tax=Eiseniibacteriota bacterium TaxID=2212470 RepID=A0A956M4B4_UNCEI|nr:50S ribosomal protein L23 [Candidatus Eisenbacteria bacterium]